MISSTHPVIHWYWPSEAEFFAELALELESESLPSELKEEIRIKLARYFSGLARERKDYKDLVGFRTHSMFELRISFSSYAEERNLRLILSNQPAGIYVLRWHVKNPNAETGVQRQLMNAAVEQAIQRLESFNLDRGGTGV